MTTQRTFTGLEARRLLRRARTGTLATLNRDGGGPYGSVVNLATDLEGRPAVFVSKLAWHTQNLLADPRASVLAAELPPAGDALTGPRVTVMGRLEPLARERMSARYAAHHPAARMYFDFADFSFWRLVPDAVHAVAGFGRIETMAAPEVFLGAADAALFDSAVEHMNADHADAARLIATRLGGGADGEWKVSAADPDGCHFEFDGTSLRVAFEETATEPGALRLAFAALTRKARAG